jgi:hypothetical protein
VRLVAAVAGALLGGFVWLGVPGAAADELMLSSAAKADGLMTATIGGFDCTTRSIRVTIDNSEVDGTPFVEVHAAVYGDDPDKALWEFYDDQGVAAGARRVVHVGAVPRSVAGPVHVFVGSEPQTSVDDGLLAERDVQTSCPKATSRPTAVNSPELTQTGGFNLAFPLLGVALVGIGGILTLSGPRSEN